MALKIEVKDLCKSFGPHQVLTDVNAVFEPNRIHGVVGRNGSGKSVLFKCICGFIPFEKGTILIDGKAVGKDLDVPPDTGTIIEEPGFLSHLSGFRNLKLLAMINNKIGDGEIRDCLELVGLDPRMKKHVGKYSLGMKQRLAIAQAIMEKPALVILDEPFNGIDISGVGEFRDMFISLKKDATVIIASHNADDIDLLCDTKYSMQDGRLSLQEQ